MAWWKDARLPAPRPLRRGAASLLAALAIAAGSAQPSWADKAADEKAAHDAYERGARAFGQGSYAVAATELARADELKPAPAALEAAMKAAILAEDPVLAMTLVDRAASRPSNDGVAAQVARAKDRFAHKVGRLTIRCDGPCSAKVGNEAVPAGVARCYLAGNYVIEITAGGAPELHAVQIPGGSTMDWSPPSKAPPPAVSSASIAPPPSLIPPPATAAPPKRSIVGPVLFAGGAGLTLVMGSLTIGFGADTLARHDAFVQDPTRDAAAAGQDAQLRTNLFLGFTLASAIAAAVAGYFAFRAPPAARPAESAVAWMRPALLPAPGGGLGVRP